MKQNKPALIFLVLASCFLTAKATAQQQFIKLNFQPSFGSEKIVFGKAYCLELESTCVSFTVIKWYISHLRCYKSGKLVFADPGNYLIDLNDKTSLIRETAIPDSNAFDEIRFCFGIDDDTNNEGIGEGDLDPSKGMYWAWQSGYINMKLEGTYKPGTKAALPFEFHLGGFLKPYAAFQEISIRIKASSNLIINADVKKFFEVLAADEWKSVMSPGEKAVQLSKKMALIFY